MPETLDAFIGRVLQWTRPSKPSSIPRTSHPNPTDVFTAARITAFNAGQSPPPVRIPTRMEEIVLEDEAILKLFHRVMFGGLKHEAQDLRDIFDFGSGDSDVRSRSVSATEEGA